MKIQYCSAKWSKEVKQFKKLPADGYSTSINNNINLYLHPLERKVNTPHIDDIGSLYSIISIDYCLNAEYNCVVDENLEECYGHLYMYAVASTRVLDLYESGHAFTNSAIIYDLERNRYSEKLIFSAVAINEYELAMKYSAKIPILDCMLRGDYDRAKQLVLELPTELSEREKRSEVYYTRQVFLWEIYLAIFDRDEKRFNEELMKRIRKYRDCPLGYATYIDVVSITLIKFARKFGLNYTFDVVEIPQYFLSDTVRVDKEKYKLPI